MNVLETITVRLHDLRNAPIVKSALRHVSTAVAGARIRIDLFHNANVQNDWHIQILRPAGSDTTEKSPFAISLAESFRPLGMIHHSVLIPVPLPFDSSKTNRGGTTRPNDTKKKRPFDPLLAKEEETR